MFKLPSLQKTYAEYCSKDPAFVQLGSDATDAERAAHEARVKRCRQRGDWSELRVEGGPEPTEFQLRPLPGDFVRKMASRLRTRDVELAMFPQIVFRMALVGIENLPDVEITREIHPVFGELASTKVTNALDTIDIEIVTELGNAAWDRGTQGVPPL